MEYWRTGGILEKKGIQEKKGILENRGNSGEKEKGKNLDKNSYGNAGVTSARIQMKIRK